MLYVTSMFWKVKGMTMFARRTQPTWLVDIFLDLTVIAL